MGVSENRGTPKSSILIGISIIFTIHFRGTTILGNTQIFGDYQTYLDLPLRGQIVPFQGVSRHHLPYGEKGTGTPWKVAGYHTLLLAGGNSNIFLCSSRNLGKIFTHFDEHIFSNGLVEKPTNQFMYIYILFFWEEK